jgi:hypothetical protein
MVDNTRLDEAIEAKLDAAEDAPEEERLEVLEAIYSDLEAELEHDHTGSPRL